MCVSVSIIDRSYGVCVLKALHHNQWSMRLPIALCPHHPYCFGPSVCRGTVTHGFNFPFLDYWWSWASFHTLVGHSFVQLLVQVSVKNLYIVWPFSYWFIGVPYIFRISANDELCVRPLLPPGGLPFPYPKSLCWSSEILNFPVVIFTKLYINTFVSSLRKSSLSDIMNIISYLNV